MRKYFIYGAVMLLMLGGCKASQTQFDSEILQKPLQSGLQVLYFDGMYRKVSQVPDGDSAMLEKGRPGPPILSINHQFVEEEVFDSGRSRGVGVQMKGYILLGQLGKYQFQALSNDGVELRIDGSRILIDPDVHADRLSEVGTVAVQETGWHPIMVKYFQRKGSAALTLFWKPPGKDEFEVIPESAYGHLQAGISEKQ
jgi:hypothetical protein